MRSITKRLALISMIPATLLGLVVLFASPAQAAAVDTKKLGADVSTLINQQRALHKCPALKTDARLINSAVGHSAYMAQTGKFSHTGRNNSSFVYRERAAHYPSPAAENIAYGYRTAPEVVTAWMHSPGHRANILNCANKYVGVGVVYAADGTPYYTQDFGY